MGSRRLRSVAWQDVPRVPVLCAGYPTVLHDIFGKRL
jgi:hypothetical protein